MFGSAIAETSVTARFEQPVFTLAWKLGWASYAEQPAPAPDHAVSVEPRVFEALLSEVPPTAVT